MNEQRIANPGSLGLLGFGMTTVLLNLCNANLVSMSVVIVAMGFAMGGLAQIIAGVMEFKRNNMFGATAFTAYGCFWWSLIFILSNPLGSAAADSDSMAFYLLLWAIFTMFMAIGTLKHNHATQIVFFSLTLLFLLLSLGEFTGVSWVTIAAGWVGIFCGLSAVYTSVAQVVNNEHGKQVMPL